jgi:site-specific DNA-methyltransferase (adenine-specific)
MILMFEDSSHFNVGKMPPGTFVFMICSDGEEHRGEMVLRKAGLEIRDSIRWFHGTPAKHLTVVVGRKPIEGTVAENTLRYGCGGINVDGCRVGMSAEDRHKISTSSWNASGINRVGYGKFAYDGTVRLMPVHPSGRWPANIIHDGSEEVLAVFPETGPSAGKPVGAGNGSSIFAGSGRTGFTYSDAGGSAARFFHTAATLEELIHYLRKMVSTTKER